MITFPTVLFQNKTCKNFHPAFLLQFSVLQMSWSFPTMFCNRFQKEEICETCKRLWARLGRPSSRCPGCRGSSPTAALSSKLFLSSGEWLVFINRLMVVDLWLVGSTLYKLRSCNVWWSLYQTHHTCHFSNYQKPFSNYLKPIFISMYHNPSKQHYQRNQVLVFLTFIHNLLLRKELLRNIACRTFS